MVYYFAYGANRNPEMIKAIIGRIPVGFSYILEDYELCIQNWKDINLKAIEILKNVGWGKSFKSYSIRYAKGSEVKGRIWKITEREHKHIANWELHNIWYSPIKIKREIKGRKCVLRTEVIDNKDIPLAKDQYDYPDFPVNKRKILEVAKMTRI